MMDRKAGAAQTLLQVCAGAARSLQECVYINAPVFCHCCMGMTARHWHSCPAGGPAPVLPEARGLWGDAAAVTKAMLRLVEQARDQGVQGMYKCREKNKTSMPHTTNPPGSWPANLCLPAGMPCAPAVVASREELLEFKHSFSRDTDGGRRWFVYDGMRRCLLEGRHSDLQAWLQQYRGLAQPPPPPSPQQQ